MSVSADPLSGIPARYAAATGAQPLFLIEGDGGLFAAKWRVPPHRIANLWAPHHVLGYRVSGISTIVRTCRGVVQRKVPPIGSVTFSPGDCPVEWSSDAPIEAIHVYIPPHELRGIRDFFGITDPWLAAEHDRAAERVRIPAALPARGRRMPRSWSPPAGNARTVR